ncbi:PucR family transcriptional regulator [Streptomyces griseorubiginosus]|uniref:Purine catabolism regulatory protein n=1 Tax=Streptomyces griseorubiginosus TaxID=67304 RepID=A0AAI8PLJ3_9ACTN|nr:helix-turn-helix domain-containing protein [Streptomyces griseorubiginosus]AYC37010.1 Purine catabolism regulatory protein [Streptomyces griseorubiginosus]
MVGSRAYRLYHRRSDRRGSLPKGGARRHATIAPKRSRLPVRTPAAHALQELAALSHALFDASDEGEILRLAMDHLVAAGPYNAEAGYLKVGHDLVPSPGNGPTHAVAVARRVRELAGQDGKVIVAGMPWGRALGLRGPAGLHGYLVVTAVSRPTRAERSLLAMLVRHTAAALSVAVARRGRHEDALELHRLRKDTLELRQLRKDVLELHRLREERTVLQRQLVTVAAELGYERAVHALMADVAASGGGEEAVTRALHGLTGLPALVEDRFGRLTSWTGPGCPVPYPEPDPVRREDMLHAVARQTGPVRIGDRVVTLIRPHGEILGVLALVDVRDEADERTVLALGHAATALALELTHLRSLAEVELRLRRELADDLLTGTDGPSAYARSAAVGHDLHGSHYIVAVQWSNRTTDDSFAQSVGRVAAAVGMRSLLTRRSDHVVLIAGDRPHAHALYEALARENGTRSGTIGVSASCDAVDDIPHHYREAQRALDVRRHSRERFGTSFFDELGLYRILGPGSGRRELERFVQEWLGQLIDYDSRHHATMVETLSRYFDCDGNYDETADSLAIHRSTLRYRLQRIRDISGHDLANVEDRLNLQVATRVWKIVLGGLD